MSDCAGIGGGGQELYTEGKMCSMYWNLIAEGNAPCGHPIGNLQTHFMGEAGSCMDYYRLGERIPDLDGFSGALPDEDLLCGSCDKCGAFYELNATIVDGAVVALGEGKVLVT